MALVPALINGVSFPTSAGSIQAGGTPSVNTFLRGDNEWAEIPGGGDMLASTYDQTGQARDIFAPQIAAQIDDIPFPKGAIGIMPITRFDSRHRSLSADIIPIGDKWVMVYRDADGHSNELTSVVKCCVSEDGGGRWSDPVTIYDEANIQIGIKQAGPMANGRIGFLAGRRSAGNDYGNPPLFMYSDDEGETWTSVILTGAGISGWSGAGHQLLPYPASVGGNDVTGFCAFSSSANADGNEINYLRTTDNGETWVGGVAIASTDPGIDYSTLAVVRLGSTNRWIMLVRQDQDPIPNGLNGLAFKSTNLFTWTGPYDTGENLNANPHTAMDWNGKVYWLACARRTGIGSRRIAPVNEGFVHQWQDHDTLWNSDVTTWPGWQELANVAGMEGHAMTFYHNGQPYATFGYNRNPEIDDTGTIVGLMGVGVKQHPVPEMTHGPGRFVFADGWVDRYPDGRQELHRVFTGLGPIETASGAFFTSSLTDIGEWYMPFVERPTMVCDAVSASNASLYAFVVIRNLGLTATHGGEVRIQRHATSSLTDLVLTVHASGRWYPAANT